MMDKVHGRVSDVLTMPTGDRISGEYVTTLFDRYPKAVRAFQVRQAKDLSIVLECVAEEGPEAQGQIEEVLKELGRRVRGEVRVTLELVDAIRHDRGKTRFVVSEVGKGSSGEEDGALRL